MHLLDSVQLGFWSYASNRIMGTLTGEVVRDGNTVTLQKLVLTMWAEQASYGTDTFIFNLDGHQSSFNLSPGGGTYLGTFYLADVSKTIDGSATTATFGWSTSDGYSGSFTVSVPPNAPTELTRENTIIGTNYFKATVSVSAWNGGDASTRYRSLSVCATDNNDNRRVTYARGDELSSQITTDNTSLENGSLLITPNTRYWIRSTASNGTNATIGEWSQLVTLAEKPTVEVESTTGDSATISYSTNADGGFYDKIIEWSDDGGETWNTAATITGGNAAHGTFTITGLTTGDNTVLVRTRTTSGSDGNVELNLRLAAVRLISSDGTTGREATRVLVSVNGVATEAARLLVSHNGIATENA